MLKRIISATLSCLCLAVISYGQDGRHFDRGPGRETPRRAESGCCCRCCETDPLLERDRERWQRSSLDHPEYIRGHEHQLRCRLCPQTAPSQPLQQPPPEDVRDFWWRRGSDGPANRGNDPR